MPNTLYFKIANVKGIDPPREVTHAGVLRVLQFDNGTFQADYFKGAIWGSFEFEHLESTIKATFVDCSTPLQVVNKMLDAIPGVELSS